eukprot:5828439-Amphidinium_carterae.1
MGMSRSSGWLAMRALLVCSQGDPARLSAEKKLGASDAQCKYQPSTLAFQDDATKSWASWQDTWALRKAMYAL